MDVKSFNRKLQKIALLIDSSSDGSDLSALEYDLLLNYIRDLYEIAIDDKKAEVKAVSNNKTQTVVTEVSAPVEPKPVFIERQEVPIPAPTSTQVEPVTSETTTYVKKEEVEIKPIVPPTIVVEEKVESQPIPKEVKYTAISKEAMAELFADEKISDLSDKLALSPVKDLTKSMGINERIFTQQELFGNNQQVFVSTLEKLNNCQNFDQAKQYLLENVINTYEWHSDNKIKKAATFIKLVKRKFS